MILVDTSVLVAYLTYQPTPGARHLEMLMELGEPLSLPAPVVQEVLQGARDEREWRSLTRYLNSQRVVEAGANVYRRAARIHYDCRRRGLTVRNGTDCVIAQLALDLGTFLLADDRDFQAISRVRPLKLVTRVELDEAEHEM